MLKDSKIIISSKGAKFDLENYPLIHYYSSAYDPGVEGVAWMTDTIRDLLEESEGNLNLIIDNTPRIENLSAKTRFEITKRFTLLDDLIKAKVNRMAFVTGSYLARIVLSTLMLIKRPQVEHKVFDTAEEALLWLKSV